MITELHDRLIHKRTLLQTHKDEQTRVRLGQTDVPAEQVAPTIEQFNYQIWAEKEVIKELEIIVTYLEENYGD